MSGPGVDCVEAAVERQSILDVEIKMVAATAAKVASDCVTDASAIEATPYTLDIIEVYPALSAPVSCASPHPPAGS